ncbi:putative non-LTR retroelement reverse transcriptase, partial [Trifolium medium]|nr:putative non-LTR retroelement reverse transcriptase [Trifolium medium]
LWGVFEGLKYARRLGYDVVELNVDSMVVKQALNSGLAGNLSGQALVKNIRRLLDLTWEVTVKHSYRVANACADALANIGCSLDYNTVFYDAPPIHIRHLLEADALGITTPRLIPL